MNNHRIERINELYHKSKKEGLTEEEKMEQTKLRTEYISSIRNNLRGTLNRVSIVNPDGSVTKVKEKKDDKNPNPYEDEEGKK